MGTIKILHDATSPETAHVDPDYPYGFRLRCKRRVWVETKKGQGQRVCTQTTNPKIAGREVWNKPKCSTYSTIKILYIDPETGYVESDAIHIFDEPEKLAAKIERYGAEAFADPWRSSVIAAMRRAHEKRAAAAAGGA